MRTYDIYNKSGKEISECIDVYGKKLTQELNVAPTIDFLKHYFQNRYYYLFSPEERPYR